MNLTARIEQFPIDVGDKDPSEAIQDLSIGKIRPMEVKESTSSVQVEASTSRQGEPRVDMEASTSATHQDEENEEVHQDEPHQPPSPPRQGNDNIKMKEAKKKNKRMKKLFHPDQNKRSPELEQESPKTIPSSKSTMISKPGESLALNLIWLIFVNTIHSSLALNL